MENMKGNGLLKTKLLRGLKLEACRFFTLLCLGIGCSITVSAQDSATPAKKVNIVPNGSFEQEIIAGGASSPEGWSFSGQTTNITGAYMTDGGHSGKRAVSITVPPPDSAVSGMWISGPIEVKPGTAYSVETWIKTLECTEGAPPKGAWLWILGSTEKNGEIKGFGTSARPTQFFAGTQDWREWSASIIIDKDIHWLRIACRLDGAGTASFDDVVISKIE